VIWACSEPARRGGTLIGLNFSPRSHSGPRQQFPSPRSEALPRTDRAWLRRAAGGPASRSHGRVPAWLRSAAGAVPGQPRAAVRNVEGTRGCVSPHSSDPGSRRHGAGVSRDLLVFDVATLAHVVAGGRRHVLLVVVSTKTGTWSLFHPGNTDPLFPPTRLLTLA